MQDSTGISQNPSSNSPFPDPSLDDKLFHLLLHPAPSLPMVPHSDIAAFVPWEEDEDDATYAGDRRDRHEFGGPHPEGSVHVRNREVQDDVFGPSIDEEDQHDNPSVTQWRVGKTPGHQGSHARTHKTTSSSECLSPTSIGEKRSLSQVSRSIYLFYPNETRLSIAVPAHMTRSEHHRLRRARPQETIPSACGCPRPHRPSQSQSKRYLIFTSKIPDIFSPPDTEIIPFVCRSRHISFQQPFDSDLCVRPGSLLPHLQVCAQANTTSIHRSSCTQPAQAFQDSSQVRSFRCAFACKCLKPDKST